MKKNSLHIQHNQSKYTLPVRFILSVLFLVFSLNIMAQPVISSFSPSGGVIGTSVTITGSGFNTTAAGNIVYFGATRATVTAATATSLTVTSPAGASYQPISILNTSNNLTGYSAQPFNTIFNSGSGQPISASSFNALVNFTTGTNPFSIVAVSDIDGDGKPDLIVANEYSNTFSVLRNTSSVGSITTASFAAKVDFATDSTPAFITVGDIDGDGKPDIIITSQFKNVISVFRNTSVSGSITSSSFASKVDFITDTLSLPSSVAIGDIDGDGKPDIAVTNLYSNTISVLRNTSSPGSITSSSFAAPVDFTAGLGPNFVTITDIDGDKKPDLVVANYNAQTVSVLRNISTAGSITTSSFATHIDFATNIGPYSLSAADINDDGKTDLVVANQGSNNVSVLVNNSTSGNISFATKTDLSSGGTSPFSVAAGNLNGDALPDLVVSNATNNTLSVLQNTYSSGTAASFGANINFITGYFPFTAIVSDLDGDGEADIAVPNDGGNTISVFRNLLPNSVVPVTLLNFTDKYQPTGNALLTWQTTYEFNASYFNVQRSIDDINFATIGKVNAIGTSSIVNNYSYTDLNIASLGVNKIFYRLQEVDKDGATTYSDIAAISLSQKANAVSVFPNPANNSITVLYPQAAANAQIQVTTIDGKTISAQTVAIGSNQTQLDISYLSSGTYILVFSDANYKAVTRFIKL